jgi:hypothetical protein
MKVYTPLVITRAQPLALLRRSRGREIIWGVESVHGRSGLRSNMQAVINVCILQKQWCYIYITTEASITKL